MSSAARPLFAAADSPVALPRVTWRLIPGKGRGVIAEEDISAGTVILRDPVVVLPPEDYDNVEATRVGRYTFEWTDDGEDLAVVLGLGSLINHGLAENVKLDSDYDAMTMVFTAIKDIKRGEELVYDYGAEPEDMTGYYGIPLDA